MFTPKQQPLIDPDDCTAEELEQARKAGWVPTHNIMNGNKAVWIRAADKGGCCDPGTETYWSM